jgi:hypothetical protein
VKRIWRLNKEENMKNKEKGKEEQGREYERGK